MYRCKHFKLEIMQQEIKKQDIKNMDHRMVNLDVATVRGFMFCTWPQERMERLFLQVIKKN